MGRGAQPGRPGPRTDDRFVGVELFQIETYDPTRSEPILSDPIQIALGLLNGHLARAPRPTPSDGLDDRPAPGRRPLDRASGEPAADACPVRRLELAGATVLVFADAAPPATPPPPRLPSDRAGSPRTGKAVLGLATGATPEPVYARLVLFTGQG